MAEFRSPFSLLQSFLNQKWPFDLDKILFTYILFVGIPTIFDYCLRRGGMPLVNFHLAIATVYLLSSLMLIFEASVAANRRSATPKVPFKSKWDRIKFALKKKLGVQGSMLPVSVRPIPRCSFIVAAYLPNEQDIILATLEHLLTTIQHPSGNIEVLLAYNSPVVLPVEAQLQAYAQQHPRLRLHRVNGSRSKAENINSALNVVTGSITCVLDADHHPGPDCFIRAWHWLEHGYDVVQGRNIIRNADENLLAQMVAIEFESIYGVSHSAKSFMVDTAIFGGSNGYWRTEVLQKIRFNPLMLTEDIDASIRTLLHGYRIIHDRSITVTELAPTRFKSFWSQRKRWAQGWLEVTLKYQRHFWTCRHFNRRQRTFWTYLLYFREVFPLMALQIFPIIFSAYLYEGTISLTSNPYILFTTVVTIFSGMYQSLIAWQVRSNIPLPKIYFIQYALLTFFFTTLKNMISAVAIYDHIQGRTEWVVTPRDKQKKSAV